MKNSKFYIGTKVYIGICIAVVIILLSMCARKCSNDKAQAKKERAEFVKDSIVKADAAHAKFLAEKKAHNDSIAEAIKSKLEAIKKNVDILAKRKARQEKLRQAKLAENARLEKERLEQEKLEKARLENERLEAENARLEKERLEQARLEKLRKLEEKLRKEEENRKRLEAEILAKIKADSLQEIQDYINSKVWRLKGAVMATTYESYNGDFKVKPGLELGVDYTISKFLRGEFDYNLMSIESALVNQFGIGLSAFTKIGKTEPYLGAQFITAIVSGEMDQALKNKAGWFQLKGGVEIPVNKKFSLYIEGVFIPLRLDAIEEDYYEVVDYSRYTRESTDSHVFNLKVGLKWNIGKK